MCTRYLKLLNKILAYLFIQVSKFNQLADERNFYDYKPENVLLILEKTAKQKYWNKQFNGTACQIGITLISNIMETNE